MYTKPENNLIVVDTVDDLFTLGTTNAPAPVDGQYVETLGYYTVGDGGANTYVYNANDVTANVDGGFLIDGLNGSNSGAAGSSSFTAIGVGRFAAVNQNVAKTSQFGANAIANGTFRLQAAINAVYVASNTEDGGKIVEVDGQVSIADTIFISGKTSLFGTRSGEIYVNVNYHDGVDNTTKYMIAMGIQQRGQAYNAAHDWMGQIKDVSFRFGSDARVSRFINLFAAQNSVVTGCEFIATEFPSGLNPDVRLRGPLSAQPDSNWLTTNPSGSAVFSILDASNTDPIVVTTSTDHLFYNGDYIRITSIGGMTEINNRGFYVSNKTNNTFELFGENGSGYTAYTSGGTAQINPIIKIVNIEYSNNTIEIDHDATSGGEGLSISNARGVRMVNNIVKGQADDSLAFHQCVDCVVAGNVVESPGCGVLLADCRNIAINGNSFIRTSSKIDNGTVVGPMLKIFQESQVTNTTQAATVSDNTFFIPPNSDGTTAMRFVGGDGVAVTGNTLITQSAVNFVNVEAGVVVAPAVDNFLPPNQRYGRLFKGKATAGGASTVDLPLNANDSDDHYNDCTIDIVAGTGVGQQKTITDYVGSTRRVTVDTAWSTQPDSTSLVLIGHRTTVPVSNFVVANNITSLDSLGKSAISVKHTSDAVIEDIQGNMKVTNNIADSYSSSAAENISWVDNSTRRCDGIGFRSIGTNNKITKLESFSFRNVTGKSFSINNVTQAHPAVVTTSASHSFSNGDIVDIFGVGGMTQLNANKYKAVNVTSTTFQLETIDGNGLLDSSGFTAYTTGGTVETYRAAAGAHNDPVGSVEWISPAAGRISRVTTIRNNTVTGNFRFRIEKITSTIIGEAQAGGASTITLSTEADSVDDTYNTGILEIVDGTGKGQALTINDYNGTTKVATMSTSWDIQPDSTSVYKITMPSPITVVVVDDIYNIDEDIENFGLSNNASSPVNFDGGDKISVTLRRAGGTFSGVTNIDVELYGHLEN